MSTSRIKLRLQTILKQRGVKGLIGLRSAFHEFDLNKNGLLSYEEFGLALQKCGLAPSPQDTRALFLEFDVDGSNEISYEEFVGALRGELSARRRNIITRVFEGIDSDGDGVISMTDIGTHFNPKNHPDVKSGKTTVPALLSDFFETFNTVTSNGYVTLNQFLEYYANAAFFEDDYTFEQTMSSIWNIHRDEVSGRRGTSLQAVAQARGSGDVSGIMEKLKQQLAMRGARGIIGLSRKFRIMDDDGSKSLSISEFKKGMRECSLDISEQEMNILFAHFDRDRNGCISYDEFLYGIRGSLNERRKRLVGMAFDRLDKDKSGYVDPEDVVDTYDASKHPDVIAGKKTKEEVFREFLDTFDVGGEKDGKVTRNEFENYYSNVSSSIDDDDYFELMIRNAWHISGGEGWCANSANKRVLVTHADGRESVEEIRDDLGLKQGDKAAMMARLRGQGVNASQISLHDGSENKNDNYSSSKTKADILNRYRNSERAGSSVSSSIEPETVASALRSLSVSSPASRSRPNTAPTDVRHMPDAGLQMIIQRLKTELRQRGSAGFIGLQRKFRIMDDDGSKTLDLAEFKKAMREMNMSLSDSELRRLFDHFDQDRSSTIDFEEFIQGVRDPLSDRRKKLVHMAFSKLDKDGSGLVDAAEVAGTYDASKHPDVLAGKKSANAVLEEFLDTFDVGGEKDGKVTRNEFENYYTNIGANIDNDDYFELMIRNAWHISGGEGWSANSANKRVLVTHADGRESVEEIRDDLGLKQGDKAAMMARLRGQGVNASQISLHDGIEDIKPASRVKTLREQYSGKNSSPSVPASSSHTVRDSLALEPDVRVALKGPSSKPVESIISHHTSTSSANKHAPVQISKTPDYGLQMIVRKLKESLKSRGAHGFIGLQRKFRIMDDDGSKSLSLSEFKKALKELGLNLSDSEIRLLFDHFDADRSGFIDFEEFIQGVRDPLNERRLTLVHMAFSKLDRENDGCISPEDLVGMYDAKMHPDVIAGKRTEDDILQEFLDTFDVGGEKDGKVTRNEFENYYTNIGANIDNDDYFELMIRNAWHISGGEGWSANSANKRVLVTHADGRESVEEIRDDLGLKQGDKAAMMARLRGQGVNATSIETAYGSEDKDRKSHRVHSAKRGASSAPAGVLPGTGSAAPVKHTSSKTTMTGGGKVVRTQVLREPSIAIQTIIRKIKAELATRGSRGYVGLQRKFRIMDDDGNKSLDLAEFKKGLKEMNISLAENEMRLIFEHFDADCSGSIDFEEFIQGVRDPLSDRRKKLVHMAFSKLDKDNSGDVDAAEVAGAYDASKHPEVIAGRMTAQQVFKEFLDTFDVGGEKDGKVTRNEFENYYTNVGANIDNDDYFELMIRNAWHISGGEGWSANSANKRVLVTHADGRESVEEIRDDLGLKQGDKAAMMARLRGQGVNATNISLHDGVDSTTKGSGKPVNLGHIARTKKTDPSRVQMVAGLSTTGKSEGMKDTLQSNHESDMSHRKRIDRQEMDYGLLGIIKQLKRELAARGARGLVGLQRKFRIMDDDGSKTLNTSEFRKAMKEMKFNLTDAEVRLLFDHFDVDRSGTIDFEEFIQGVRDPLNDRRRKLVHMAFSKLDKDNNGYVDAADIIDSYDASKHPDVLAGKKSANAVLEEFLDTFDVGGEKDGKVTRNEFENYYTNIGANIDNDDYFELMIRNAWHISGGEGWSANSANKRVLVTHADGRESVEEIRDDLGLKQGDSAAAIARLRKQGVNTSQISFHDGVDTRSTPIQGSMTFDEIKEHMRAGRASYQNAADRPSGRRKSSNTRIFQSSIKLGDDGESSTKKNANFGGIKRSNKSFKAHMSGAQLAIEEDDDLSRIANIPHAASLAAHSLSRKKDIGAILHDLKSQLATRGARGIVGLSRKFRIMDDDGSGALSVAEFKKAMRECSLELSDENFRVLFSHFDRDGDGSIDFDEFLHGLRGEMSERRKRLVGMAFDRLDKDKSGIIDPEDIIDTYDASKHPDVIAGKKTKEEVFREFLDTFDVGGEKDGKVTRNEFENYYSNVSSSIDDDDYFELMIRNAWHISGGEGWSANSANKRVLVTHADGRESVEEIRDDLGLKQGDKTAMMARLRGQGVNATNISLHDGSENKNDNFNAGTAAKFNRFTSPTFKSQFTIG